MPKPARYSSLLIVIVITGLGLTACTEDQSEPAITLPLLTRPTLTLTDPVNVTVPISAVAQRGGATGVFVLQDQQARFRMVRVGKQIGQQHQVLSGLQGSEILILGDLTDVHDGNPIKVE